MRLKNTPPPKPPAGAPEADFTAWALALDTLRWEVERGGLWEYMNDHHRGKDVLLSIPGVEPKLFVFWGHMGWETRWLEVEEISLEPVG